MATAGARPPARSYDVDVTVVSAKHLKNVNWRHGDLKPYVILWIDPDRRLATKSDDSGSTKPVWNERFVLPLTLPPQESLLTVEIFHSVPSETAKPLVGTLRIPLKDLVDSGDSTQLRNFELRRPSGRPQGKIRLKIAVRKIQEYQIPPPASYYYSSAPPPPATRDYGAYNPAPYTSHAPPLPPTTSPPPPLPPPHTYPYGGYSDPYYPCYYSQPPPPPRPWQSAAPGPSAPVDYAPYDHQRSGKMGAGAGLAAGAVAGALGGLALNEGLKYEEEKIAERTESDIAAMDDYGKYQHSK
nr:protein SRC2 homolog [Ipomoea trifida]